MYNKEFDNIEIPENIDLYIKKGLKKAVNEKKSKKYRINKFIKQKKRDERKNRYVTLTYS